MKRTDIINHLISKKNLKSYLEIGIGDGVNYNQILCDYKENVDIVTDETNSDIVINKMTSDEYFNICSRKFDIIFIDGLHTFEQTYTDIMNALKFINYDGFIIAHDTLPPTKNHQRDISEYVVGQEWNGTCWKAIAKIRTERNDLVIKTVDADWGVSIIQNGYSELYPINSELYTYEYFSINRSKLMNIITPQDFINIIW